MTVIIIAIGALSTVTKGLIQGLDDIEIRGQAETFQTAALLRLTKILRRISETWGDSSAIESLLIAAQNNAVRTNHIKARIDKTQQNSKFRICGDRDETINRIISECSKLAQKEYKTRHDWVGKVIHWEMCKKFKFDHTNKWYMQNPAPVLENNTH